MNKTRTQHSEQTSAAAEQAEASLDAAQQAMNDLGAALQQQPAGGPEAAQTFGSGAAAASRAAKSGRVVHASANDDLPKMDQALAADIDHLLQGDFESIDAVLEGVFEEKAALVQTDAMPKASPPSKAALGKTVREVTAMAPPRTSTAVEVRAPAPEPPPPPPPEPDETVAGAEFAAQQIDADDKQEVSPAPRAQARPAERREPRPKPSANPPGAPSTSLLRKANQGVLALLAALNAPLRLLPARLRPAINIIAFTLILWAPTVWLIAPLFRKAGDAINAHVADANQEHQEPEHAEPAGASAGAPSH